MDDKKEYAGKGLVIFLLVVIFISVIAGGYVVSGLYKENQELRKAVAELRAEQHELEEYARFNIESNLKAIMNLNEKFDNNQKVFARDLEFIRNYAVFEMDSWDL